MPMRQEGTEFQKRVWRAISGIPYGETATYREIAERSGSPGAWRAVGGAANRNRLQILVPRHRVVGTGGKIGGFSAGVGKKEDSSF